MNNFKGSLLLLHCVALTLQPLKLAEGGGGVLVEAAGDGLGLLRLANQDGVTPKHHRHVLDLVSVDPSQDFGAVWVRRAARDSVQRVQVDGLLVPGFAGDHSDSLWFLERTLPKPR
uniref:Secreted protein n=1 Tax=Oryzias melastigma TaxID=30732 RepID=A0A3B3CFF0_ORYME